MFPILISVLLPETGLFEQTGIYKIVIGYCCFKKKNIVVGKIRFSILNVF